MRLRLLSIVLIILAVSAALGVYFFYFAARPAIWLENLIPFRHKIVYPNALDGTAVFSPASNTPFVVAVMIDNHPDARPQSGLSSARVVYEAPVEGSFTRYLALFALGDGAALVGPVRSARLYFLDWLPEYGRPLYFHAGGSPQALAAIRRRAIHEAIELAGADYYHRVRDRLPPHNLFTDSEKWGEFFGERETSPPTPLLPARNARARPPSASPQANAGRASVAGGRGEGDQHPPGRLASESVAGRPRPPQGGKTVMTPPSTFARLGRAPADKSALPIRGEVGDVMAASSGWKFDRRIGEINKDGTKQIIIHYNNFYSPGWIFDPATGFYGRTISGAPYADADGKPVLARNVIIQEVNMKTIDEEGRREIQTVGVGAARIFTRGAVIIGAWKKLSLASRTRFYDANSNEVILAPGATWVEVMAKGTVIETKD